MISLLTVLLIVFVLSCFIGYHVIWGVTPALHTPLMAVTNAISGIVIVGAIIVTGSAEVQTQVAGAVQITPVAVKWIGFVAVIVSSINIFGGFVVTRRMLAMFRKK